MTEALGVILVFGLTAFVIWLAADQLQSIIKGEFSQ